MCKKILAVLMTLTALSAKSAENEKLEVKEIRDPKMYSAEKMSAGDINNFYEKRLPTDKFNMWHSKKDRQYLHGTWKFIKLANTRYKPNCNYGLQQGFEKSDFDDSTWLNQPVPFDWSLKFGTDIREKTIFWSGVGWYRTKFTIPPKKDKMRVILHCEMIDNISTVFVNGKKAGEHENFQFDYYDTTSFTQMRPNSFEIDITDLIKHGEENSLAIRVYDDGTHTTGVRASKCVGWGGIWQDIFLEYRPQIYLDKALITPILKENSISIKAFIYNMSGKVDKLDLTAVIGPWTSNRYNFAKGKAKTYKVGIFELKKGENTVNFKLRLDHPEKWSTENPYLYHFKLLDGKSRLIGQERFGFRDIAVGKHLFKLNGTDIFLMGRQIETMGKQLYCPLGHMNQDDNVYKFLTLIKKANYNFCRAHSTYLPSPFYQIGDELGLLYYDEIKYPRQKKASWIPLDRLSRMYNVKTGELTQEMKKNIKETVYKQYNHPSSIIRSVGNEIWDNRLIGHELNIKHGFDSYAPYLNKVIEEFHKYDNTRPVTPCSGRAPSNAASVKTGGAAWSQSLGTPARGDFYDVHRYSWNPPLELDSDENIRNSFRELYEAFAVDAGKPRAVLNGEVGGTVITMAGSNIDNWTQRFFKGRLVNGKLDKKWFLDTFGESVYEKIPFYGKYSSRLECFYRELAEKSSRRHANARHVKRLYEMLRCQRKWIAGYANCYHRLFYSFLSRCSAKQPAPLKVNYPAAEYIRAAQQPLLACFSCGLNRNLITGKTYNETIHVMNDYLEKMDDVSVKISLWQNKTKQYEFPEIQIASLKPAEIRNIEIKLVPPSNLKSGHYRGVLETFVKGVQKSSNWSNYDFYILNQADIKTDANKPVTIFIPPGSAGKKEVKDTLALFKKLQIPFEKLTDLNKVSGEKVLFIPPFILTSSFPNKVFTDWLLKGGKVVCFEQKVTPFNLPGTMSLCRRAGFKTEFLDPEYPLMKDLDFYDFFMWNGDGKNIMSKWFFSYALKPISQSTQAIAQPDNYTLAATVSEMKVGKGLVLLNQLEALERFESDAVATKYLLNILNHTLNEWDGKHAAEVKLIDKKSGTAELAFDKSCAFKVDLRPHVNMGFSDDKAYDGKGGWTDQGPEKDMRNLPTGNVRMAGVDFDIIKPETNNGRSCIVLKGPKNSPVHTFGKTIEKIKVGRKVKKLYFLISAAYVPRTKKCGIAEIQAVYSGGSTQVLFTSLSLDIVSGKNIVDWCDPLPDLPEAVCGWVGPSGKQGLREVRAWVIEWVNPEPGRTISHLNFISTELAVPILIAITGEELL